VLPVPSGDGFEAENSINYVICIHSKYLYTGLLK
jgi:hypothetical protein